MSIAQAATKLTIALLCYATCTFSAGASREPVETEIKGFVSRNGKPVAGLVVTTCGDLGSSPYEPTHCARPIRVTTDKFGRFQFLKFTGDYPPQVAGAGYESSVWCELCDPGWSYWFEVAYGNRTRLFSSRGMGFGIAYARLDCQLPERRDETERLQCDAIEIQFEVPIGR